MDKLYSIRDLERIFAERWPDNPPAISTIKQWARQGKFPGARIIGNSYIIPAADVAAFERPPMGRPRKDEESEQ